MTSATHRYVFGDHVREVTAQQLLRNGQPVARQPLTYQLLLQLARAQWSEADVSGRLCLQAEVAKATNDSHAAEVA